MGLRSWLLRKARIWAGVIEGEQTPEQLNDLKEDRWRHVLSRILQFEPHLFFVEDDSVRRQYYEDTHRDTEFLDCSRKELWEFVFTPQDWIDQFARQRAGIVYNNDPDPSISDRARDQHIARVVCGPE